MSDRNDELNELFDLVWAALDACGGEWYKQTTGWGASILSHYVMGKVAFDDTFRGGIEYYDPTRAKEGIIIEKYFPFAIGYVDKAIDA